MKIEFNIELYTTLSLFKLQPRVTWIIIRIVIQMDFNSMTLTEFSLDETSYIGCGIEELKHMISNHIRMTAGAYDKINKQLDLIECQRKAIRERIDMENERIDMEIEKLDRDDKKLDKMREKVGDIRKLLKTFAV